MEEGDFNLRLECLYALERNPVREQEILPAISLPENFDILETNFDLCMREAAYQINHRVGHAYVSIRYEGSRRWSLLGSENADYMDFCILTLRGEPPVHALRVIRRLLGASYVQCNLHGSDMDALRKDLRSAMRTISDRAIVPPASLPLQTAWPLPLRDDDAVV